MRQSDSVSEELDTENVQCALDFENTMNAKKIKPLSLQMSLNRLNFSTAG